jgi:hypothetical protein
MFRLALGAAAALLAFLATLFVGVASVRRLLKTPSSSNPFSSDVSSEIARVLPSSETNVAPIALPPQRRPLFSREDAREGLRTIYRAACVAVGIGLFIAILQIFASTDFTKVSSGDSKVSPRRQTQEEKDRREALEILRQEQRATDQERWHQRTLENYYHQQELRDRMEAERLPIEHPSIQPWP